MYNLKWNNIISGAMFEGLVTTIVYFEDHNAKLFGREGRDGGQDVRSGDNTMVYQAKFHKNPTASKAINDAKAELSKISKYRSKKHARYTQWSDVTHWRLCTNASFNPTDYERWETEIIPLFDQIGLKADYWESTTLESLIAKYPAIYNEFFENENRVFITLPEVRSRFEFEPEFVIRANQAKFHGRKSELTEIANFLSSNKLFALIHGAGGIGKTRLLFEIGQLQAISGDWQVLWANVASMESNNVWFRTMLVERKTLLLIDEPESELHIRTLLEQIAYLGSRCKWKVVFTVRSPKDPVLRLLKNAKIKSKVQEIVLDRLPIASAADMCFELLSRGKFRSESEEWRKNVALKLANLYDQHPVWMSLAVYVFEEKGNLRNIPESSEDLAEFYLEEIVKAQTKYSHQLVINILRWVALLHPVNLENEAVIRTIVSEIDINEKSAVRTLLAWLVSRHVLVKRGARNRLVEIKPDVISEYILKKWLTADIDFENNSIIRSDAAEALIFTVIEAVQNKSISSKINSILRSIVRTEVTLSYGSSPIDLLTPLFDGLKSLLPNLSANSRVLLAGLISVVAEYRSDDVVQLSSILRTQIAQAEVETTIFKTKQISQDDVILSLAWPVYHAGLGCVTSNQRYKVLNELIKISVEEGKISRDSFNNGKQAIELIGRILEEGTNDGNSFDAEAVELSLNYLTFSKNDELPLIAIESMLKTVAGIERTRTWSENGALILQKWVMPPDCDAWIIRSNLLSNVREQLENESTPDTNRILFWHVFIEGHKSVLRAFEQHKPKVDYLKDELISNMEWAHKLLLKHKLDLKELESARNLWEWHLQFDKDIILIDFAKKLEKLYFNNALAREFDPLISQNIEGIKQKETRAQTKAIKLAIKAPQSITSFVSRALRFFDDPKRIDEIFHVAKHLGKIGLQYPSIKSFVIKTFEQSDEYAYIQFASVTASHLVWEVRNNDAKNTHAFVQALIGACCTPKAKTNLLLNTYNGISALRNNSMPTDAEIVQLRAFTDLFLSEGQGPVFVGTIGWTLEYDWEGLKIQINAVISKIPNEQKPWAMTALVDSFYWGIRAANEEDRDFPLDAGIWLLEKYPQILNLPRGNMVEWHLKEIFEHVNRPTVLWLDSYLKLLSKEEKYERVSFSKQNLPSRFVKTLLEEDKDSSEIEAAILGLIDLYSDNGSIGYHLPKFIIDLDPDGLIVPDIVVQKLAALSLDSQEFARRLARIAGQYQLNGSSWRIMALPFVKFVLRQDERTQHSLFFAMTKSSTSAWSSPVGEVPVFFAEKVQEAKNLLNNEKIEHLKRYWEWYLKEANTELQEQEELAKEDRGE
jgi:hypothetical protein